MLTITNILNPLTGGATHEEYVWKRGMSLAEYIRYDGECIIARNGKVVDKKLIEIVPKDNERFVFMVLPEGGDKQTYRVLGHLSMAALTFVPGWGAPVALIGSTLIDLLLQDKAKENSPYAQSYSWKHIRSQTAAHGSAMPVIYGKTRIRPILKNRYIVRDDDRQRLYALYGIAAHKVDEVSETTYSRFQPSLTYNTGDIVRTPLDADEPGKTYRCASDGTQGESYLDANYWEVGNGTATFNDQVIINGRSITDYSKGVDWETRPGLPSQSVIIGFDATYSNFPQDGTLYTDAPAPDWAKAAISYQGKGGTPRLWWAAHTLYLYGELYQIGSGRTNTLPELEICYLFFDPFASTIDYTLQTDGSLPSSPTAHIIASIDPTKTIGAVTRYTNSFPDDKTWFSPAELFTVTHNIEIVIEFPTGLYETNDKGTLKIGTCKIFAQYRDYSTDDWIDFDFEHISVSNKVTFEAINTYGGITAGILERSTAKSITITMKAALMEEPLDPNKTYQIRICADSPSIVKLTNVATIIYGEENADGSYPGFTYPGEPLLGIKALASGQISSDLDVQVDVERSLLWIYDGSLWTQKRASNHAWAVWDILVNGHPDHKTYPTYGNEFAEAPYGCGISPSRIDYDSFEEWANYIDSLGDDDAPYSLNIVFDSLMTAWDAILMICREGRGFVYPVGTKIYALADMPRDPVQMFSVGSIHMDTFVQQYMGSKQKANMIEATYYDSERNYEKTTIASRTSDWDSSTDLNTPTAVTLLGTTTYWQANVIAGFMLLNNELLDNLVTFDVGVDALAAQVGDVIRVQHDIMVGNGGRIVSYIRNLLLNSGFEAGTYTSAWVQAKNTGENPTLDVITGTKHRSGSYSSRIQSDYTNTGRRQRINCLPNTEYSFSAWVWLETAAGENTGGNFRIASSDNIMTVSKSEADTTILDSAWQYLSFTMTTAANQTVLYLFYGGKGAGYWDDLQVEIGSMVHGYVGYVGVELDKNVTLTSESYTLGVKHSNGEFETKTTNIGAGTHSVLTFGTGTVWSIDPTPYDVYVFGLTSDYYRLYRILSISRTNDLMRTVTAMKYDEDVYDVYSPADTPTIIPQGEAAGKMALPPNTTVEEIASLLNLASNVKLQEVLSRNRTTGEYESTILVMWDAVDGDPRGTWEVWFRDVDVSDINWQGEWGSTETYDEHEKVEYAGATYICLRDGTTSRPVNTT